MREGVWVGVVGWHPPYGLLRASIAAAYQAEGESRTEVFKLLMPLRDGGQV